MKNVRKKIINGDRRKKKKIRTKHEKAQRHHFTIIIFFPGYTLCRPILFDLFDSFAIGQKIVHKYGQKKEKTTERQKETSRNINVVSKNESVRDENSIDSAAYIHMLLGILPIIISRLSRFLFSLCVYYRILLCVVLLLFFFLPYYTDTLT